MPDIITGTNSYISTDEADTYHAGNVAGDSWLPLDQEVKERSVISATRMLDRQMWKGAKTSSVQALQWPRTEIVDPYGNAVSSGTVPQFIEDATAELALALALDPTVQTSTGTNKNIKRVKAGSAEVEFFFSSINTRFGTVIQELIGSYLGSTSSLAGTLGIGGFASGTDQCSKFIPGDYDRSEAL